MKANKGFTLVEMLVVISVLSLFGIVALTIFSRTLVGSNKSKIILAMKQNGQSVLETIDSTIRNASLVLCPSPNSTSTILVVVNNGVYTRFKFIDPVTVYTDSTNQIIDDTKSKNSAIQEDFPVPLGDINQFKNNVCSAANPLPVQLVNAVVLTDTNPQSGVSVSNPGFTRDTKPGFKDIIKINFVLSQGMNAPPIIAGQIDPVTFATTVQLRKSIEILVSSSQ